VNDLGPRVETQLLQHGSPENPITLRGGASLPGIQIAYETWGTLNADASNAILVFHALSGSHHASGYNPSLPAADPLWQPETHDGWWNSILGQGKAIDTEQYFVVCANYLGGCYGTTGPSSLDPRTSTPYGSKFPRVQVADQADLSAVLLDHLGIQALHAIFGPSVGGLCALTFSHLYPDRVHNIVSIASGLRTTVLNKLILFEQILAIENDRHFNGGDYYQDEKPDLGLALARMISHKTFVHLDAFERRARRDVVQSGDHLAWYTVQDQFQSYMLHQGKKFVKRFDANTYLRIIDMWSSYNAVIEGQAKDFEALFSINAAAGHKILIFSIDSDFCFYPEEQAELVQGLETAGVDSMHITVHSDKGHDSFLLEPEYYAPHIDHLLKAGM